MLCQWTITPDYYFFQTLTKLPTPRDIVGLQLLFNKLMSPFVFHMNRMYTSLIDGPRMPDRKNSRKEGIGQVWQYMPIISILGR